jgi:bacterioferritin-associated ferredoxin
MYVCNCNGVKRREVDEAIRGGADDPEAVLGHFGLEPCCGRCLPDIADQICLARQTCQTRRAIALEAALVQAE